MLSPSLPASSSVADGSSPTSSSSSSERGSHVAVGGASDSGSEENAQESVSTERSNAALKHEERLEDDLGDEDDVTMEAASLGRRQLDSDSSDYQPNDDDESSSAQSAGEAVEYSMETARQGGNEERSHAISSRKRHRPQEFSNASAGADSQRLKRIKGVVNYGYLSLLNREIEDTARQYLPADGLPLGTSQIGLTIWTAEEKQRFYEALGRLGRDDVPGISQRVGSKGEVEVRQYLQLLQAEATSRRLQRDQKQHRQPLQQGCQTEQQDRQQAGNDSIRLMPPWDSAAAAEVSQACCEALEQAADCISLRAEEEEDREEVRKWGPGRIVTGWNCKRLTEAAGHLGQPKAAVHATSLADEEGSPRPQVGKPAVELSPESARLLAFFQVQNWLELSERVFMNGPLEDSNWRSVGEPPSIRMTALEDMHSLTLMVTQRLMAAAIYVCLSRIRAKTPIKRTQNLVRRQDVEAASASLGLAINSERFWASCARRLGLRVYEDRRDILAKMGKRGRQRPRARSAEADENKGQGGDSGDDSSRSENSSDNSDDNSGDEERNANSNDEDGRRAIGYDEVEAELLLPKKTNHQRLASGLDEMEIESSVPWGALVAGAEREDLKAGEEEGKDDDDSAGGEDHSRGDRSENSADDVNETDNGGSEDEPDALDDDSSHGSSSLALHERVRTEVDELVGYSAFGYFEDEAGRRSLARHIKTELKQEARAERADEQASRTEEAALWALLGREPPVRATEESMDVGFAEDDHEGLDDTDDKSDDNAAQHLSRRNYLLDEIFEAGRDWRDHLVFRSDWELPVAESGK